MLTNTYPNILSATAGGGGIPAAPPLKCPRCNSTNTKFCYYNNYSLAQPRHFCKTCKRYWTRGGTLRDVPIGGGCRKNKRHKKPQSSAAAATLPLRRLPNSLPSPASDLCSPIYGVPPTDLGSFFFPRFEETIESGIGSHLADNLQQSAPLLCYDDLSTGMCEGLSLIRENPIEADSAYLYSWPESCSSVVHLL